jgi:hypothetical protein
MSNKNR